MGCVWMRTFAPRKSKPLVHVVAFAAHPTEPFFGCDIGVISGALRLIVEQFKAASQAQEFVVNSLLVGEAFLTLLEVAGPSSTFRLYGGLNIIFFILLFLLLLKQRKCRSRKSQAT